MNKHVGVFVQCGILLMKTAWLIKVSTKLAIEELNVFQDPIQASNTLINSL